MQVGNNQLLSYGQNTTMTSKPSNIVTSNFENQSDVKTLNALTANFDKIVPVMDGRMNPDKNNELRIFSDDQKRLLSAPILTPRREHEHDITTSHTFEDGVGLDNVMAEESDEEEDESKTKKGFKAISKEMCMTIRVMNPKTNRYKRTFKCLVDGCGRTFAKSCNMAVHLRKHTGDKPYFCPHCPKMFSQSGILSRHLKNVHKQSEKRVSIKVTHTSSADDE